jgi:glycine/D-amino acid oxidase-like deaminating enzyme
VELVVVGGGIVGLATAYWLLRAGRRPLLLEAHEVAAHASGRNAGFLLTGTAEPYGRFAAAAGETAVRRVWELSRSNRQLLRSEILDAGKIDCDFLAEGSWIAALAGTAQEEELRQSAERLAAQGFEVEWREAAEVRKASGSSLLGGAIFQSEDGGLDPVALCRGLADLLMAGGCEVRTGAPVLGIEPAAGGGVLLRCASRLVRAERAVLALNAYAPRLLPHLAGAIEPVRGQILVTAPVPRDLTGVWYINDGYEYARQLPDGAFLLGGCRWAAREIEVGYLETPTATVQGELERFRAAAFPRFARVPVERRWAGTMALTADGLPLLGAVPEVPGAFFAAGLNGHGMSLGFAIGRHLAGLLLGETPAPLFDSVASSAGSL